MEPPTITVNEYDLLALPRRRAPGERIIHECASATARWVLENSYRRLRPTTRDIRVEYDRQWLSHPGHQQLDPDSVAYAKLLLRGPRIAKRLSDLIDGFCVYVPVTPSPPRLLTEAASGSLKPPPTRRLRRICLHLSYSIAPSGRVLDTTPSPNSPARTPGACGSGALP